MRSFDSGILLSAFSRASPSHDVARGFLEDLTPRDDVAVSELVLVELHTLLSNPPVLVRPFTPTAAVDVVQSYRCHSRWMLLGFDPDSVALHDELWTMAAQTRFGRPRIHDARLALSLRRQGVSDFATANAKDFGGFGFARVWNSVG